MQLNAYEDEIRTLKAKVAELQYELMTQTTSHQARYAALEARYRKALESATAQHRNALTSSITQQSDKDSKSATSDVGAANNTFNNELDLEQAQEEGREEDPTVRSKANPVSDESGNDDKTSYGIISPRAAMSPFSEYKERGVEMYVFYYYHGTVSRTVIGAFSDEMSAKHAADKQIRQGSFGCWSHAQDIMDCGRRIARLLIWTPSTSESECST